MKKEIDMGMFLEDDARYADAVNVFGDMPEGTVTEEAVEPYDTKIHFAVGKFLLPHSQGRQEGTSRKLRGKQEGASGKQRGKLEETSRKQRTSIAKRIPLQQHRNRFTTKYRDMVRRVIFGMNFVIAELELQETVDYSYPLRDMIYTCGEYEQQARKIRRLVRRSKKKEKSRVVLSDESPRNSSAAAKTDESSSNSVAEANTDESLKSRKAATRSNGRAETTTDKNQKKLHLRPGEYLYGFRKESRLRPTVIFLLYFGEEPWDGPTCIHDMLDFTDIPEKMKSLVQNHRINLIDVRRMSDEVLDRFQTDVGKVLRVIKNAENKEELKKLVETDSYYKEMEQDAYLVTANYIKADELLDYEKYEDGGKCDMCKAIKELIEDGREEGREEGRKEGQIHILVDLLHDNVINVSEAARRMGITEKEFLEKQMELQNRE